MGLTQKFICLNVFTTVVLSAVSFSSSALAGGHMDDGARLREHSGNLRSCLYNSPSRGNGNHGGNCNNGGNGGGKNPLPLTVVNCGDIITSSIRIANDLSCPDATGFALSVKGDNVTVDGNGHSISAPNAIAGVYAQGTNISLTNLNIQGIVNGEGVFAYDSPSLSVKNSNLSNNQIGVVIYAEQTTMSSVEISSNKITDSSLFGIRAGQDGIGSIVLPQISKNDLSRSGSYALRLQVSKLELDGCDGNVFKSSVNGIYLQTGDFLLQNLSLSGALIQKAAIFVDSASSIVVKNVDVSSAVKASPSQERMGLDLYRCAHFEVRGLVAIGNDVGLKLETENGVSPTGSIKNCLFLCEVFAGIMITSYDSTQYGNIDLDCNVFKLAASAIANIFTSSGTIWAAI